MNRTQTETAALTTPESDSNNRPSWWLWAVAIVFFALPILITTYNASLSRMVADDYEYATVAEREGAWGAVTYWYDTWTGNYSSSFLQSYITLMDPAALGWLMSSTILLWWIGSCWLAFEVVHRLQWPRPHLMGLLAGSLLLVVTIDGMPNIYETLYWAAGGIAHVVPLVGVVYFVAFLLFFTRHRPSRPAIIIATLLTVPYILIVAGFSTPSTAHLIVLVILLMAAFWRFTDVEQRRAALPILLAALLAALIALVIIALAPGTEIRQTRFPPTPGLLELALFTLAYTLGFASAELGILAPVSLLLTLLLAGWAGYRFYPGSAGPVHRHRWRLMGGVLLIGLLPVAAAFSTGAYAMSTYLPHRANTTPAYTFVLIIAACGYIMGITLRSGETSGSARLPRLLMVVLIGLLLLGPGMVLRSSLTEGANMTAFKHDWQTIHRTLRAAAANGEQDVVVDGFTFDLGAKALGGPLDSNPETDANRDLALYYGLNSVIAR